MRPRNSLLALIAVTITTGTAFIDGIFVGDAAAQSKGQVVIGEVVPASKIHIISHPGRYGLGPELPGSQYAIVDNMLVRLDPKTHEIQSIIRRVDKILD